ncbi:MAG: peptidoglycan-associated lipoprotein Pal [Nitrosomonadaceae bacterium]|nr:peptidoglycan-associated lipoprotein Pal [Nitrosomonadaceae bacterium]
MSKILGVVLISLLSACASKTIQPTSGTGTEGSSVATAPAAPKTAAINPLNDPNNILSKRSVYFNLDSFVVKDEYKSLVSSHANYLRENATAKVLLQGSADERGSREYNLALGQRRADSVKKAMTLSGTKEAQIEAVSLGEEKPRGTDHNETSWAENRRTDIRYQGE